MVKRGGKQIWKSLKTTDRKLAERRQAEFVAQASNLRPQENPHVAFETRTGIPSRKEPPPGLYGASRPPPHASLVFPPPNSPT